MDANNLYPIALSDVPDQVILDRFLKADLPDSVVADIAAFFDTACATDVATLVQKRYDRFRKFGSEV